MLKGNANAAVAVVNVVVERFDVAKRYAFARCSNPFEAARFGIIGSLLCRRGVFRRALVLADVDEVVANILPVDAQFAVFVPEEKGDFLGFAIRVFVIVQKMLAANIDTTIVLVSEFAGLILKSADTVFTILIKRKSKLRTAINLYLALIVTKNQVATGRQPIHFELPHKGFAMPDTAFDVAAAARAAGS